MILHIMNSKSHLSENFKCDFVNFESDTKHVSNFIIFAKYQPQRSQQLSRISLSLGDAGARLWPIYNNYYHLSGSNKCCSYRLA